MAKAKVSQTAATAPKKSDQPKHPPIGQLLSALLKHPDTPVSVYNAIGEEICDMQRQEVTETPEYIQTLFQLYKQFEEKEAAKKAGGAQ